MTLAGCEPLVCSIPSIPVGPLSSTPMYDVVVKDLNFSTFDVSVTCALYFVKTTPLGPTVQTCDDTGARQFLLSGCGPFSCVLPGEGLTRGYQLSLDEPRAHILQVSGQCAPGYADSSNSAVTVNRYVDQICRAPLQPITISGCNPIAACVAPLDVKDRFVLQETDTSGWNFNVTAECAIGYIASGPATATPCTKEGGQYVLQGCEGLPCPELHASAFLNTSFLGSNFSHFGGAVRVLCDDGYNINGDDFFDIRCDRFAVSNEIVQPMYNQADLTKSCSLIPVPPVITASVLSADGAILHLHWSVPTNTPANPDCSKLFDATSLLALGRSLSCLWSSPTSLEVRIGVDATFLVGVPNALRTLGSAQGVIKTMDYAVIAESQQLNVEALSGATFAVSAEVLAPELVGLCDTIFLDARGSSNTGSFGRELGFQWSALLGVPSGSEDQYSVRLENASSTVTLVPAELQGVTALTIRLQVTNWLGNTDSTTFTVQRAATALPSVSVPFAVITHPVYQSLSIQATSTFASDCLGAASGESWTVAYKWTQQTPPSPSVLPAVDNKSLLQLYSYSLAPGQTYMFDVTVTYSRAQGSAVESVTNSKLCTVLTPRSQLQAVLIPGTSLISTTQATVMFDASDSFDHSLWSTSDQGLEFSWQCSRLSALPCQDFAPLLSKAQLNTANVGVEDAYTVTVTVSKPNSISATAHTILRFTATSVPFVSVAVINPSVTSFGKLNPSERLSLVATSADEVAWRWECPTLDMTDLDLFLSPTTAGSLVVSPNTLTPGAQYTFTAFATFASDSSAEGFASVLVTINSAPSLGTCSVTPAESDYGEPVAVSCAGWTDADSPLTYRFGFVTSTGEAKQLVDWQPAGTRNLVLPVGNFSVSIEIRDALEAATTFRVSRNRFVSSGFCHASE